MLNWPLGIGNQLALGVSLGLLFAMVMVTEPSLGVEEDLNSHWR
ncbi:hypothetical protein N9D66_01020 [Candidatus Nanopelagicales bacterium]|nr:hypothetical protein [Candidatus Nanopelagicales bacterium]